MVGFAWNALREAVFGLQADRLPLVRYVSLTANPLGVLAAIYETIGEKPFPMTRNISSRATTWSSAMHGSARRSCTMWGRRCGHARGHDPAAVPALWGRRVLG